MLREMAKDKDQNNAASFSPKEAARAGGQTMKNDYDAEYEADTLNYGSSGNGGLRWMSMLVMALVVFGFFSLVWYAYNASMTEQQQQAVAVIAPENQEYKVKPENAGGMPIDNKDIEAYQLMRRQPSAQEEASKVERLLPETDSPALSAQAPVNDPVRAGEVATITNAEAGIASHPKPETRETLALGGATTSTLQGEITPSAAPTTQAPTSATAVSPTAPSAEITPARPVETKPAATVAPAPASTTAAQIPTAAAIPEAAPAEVPVSVVKQPVHTVPAKPIVQKPKPAVTVKSEAIKHPSPKVAAVKPKTVTAAVPAGSAKAYVQLGALRSAADVEALWTKLHGANKDVLGAATHSVEPVSVAGTGTLYRLRARGFASREAAVTACSGLKGRGLTCIVSQ